MTEIFPNGKIKEQSFSNPHPWKILALAPVAVG